jgi:misacylated tRNA(Ala) deacylase
MELLFRQDAYLTHCEARLIGVTEAGGLQFDRTVFYGTSGGQPGDSGMVTKGDGSTVAIKTAITGATKDEIVHMPIEGAVLPSVGETVTLTIDWSRRLNLSKMHTACHILSVVCPFPITGAAVNEDDSRVDFDLPDPAYSAEYVSEKMMEIIHANHPVTTRWITEDELDANSSIVRSKNVRPPRGLGRIRLVLIGENGIVDSQPCGGTHVSSTGQIGPVYISKIEKKGRENRRFRICFGTFAR